MSLLRHESKRRHEVYGVHNINLIIQNSDDIEVVKNLSMPRYAHDNNPRKSIQTNKILSRTASIVSK